MVARRDKDAADSGDDAIDDEGLEVAFSDRAGDGVAEPSESAIDQVHGDAGEFENGPEDGEHEAGENEPAFEGVKGVGVNLVGEGER